MIYVKQHFAGGATLNVPLHKKAIYTNCDVCGKEINVTDKDMVDIIQGFEDFDCVAVTCDACNKKQGRDNG